MFIQVGKSHRFHGRRKNCRPQTFGSDIKAKAQLFSSGMAAIAAVILANAKAGDKILTQPQLYGTTDELIQKQLSDWQIGNIRCDLNDFKNC